MGTTVRIRIELIFSLAWKSYHIITFGTTNKRLHSRHGRLRPVIRAAGVDAECIKMAQVRAPSR
jgi:hypothetical protein